MKEEKHSSVHRVLSIQEVKPKDRRQRGRNEEMNGLLKGCKDGREKERRGRMKEGRKEGGKNEKERKGKVKK